MLNTKKKFTHIKSCLITPPLRDPPCGYVSRHRRPPSARADPEWPGNGVQECPKVLFSLHNGQFLRELK